MPTELFWIKSFRFWLLLLLLAAPLISDATEDWEEVKNQDGIRIYTRQATDSPIVMAKGIVVIDATPEAIMQVLDDNASHPMWIPYLKVSRQLQAVADKERLEYNLFDAPWPASNRDFVFRVIAVPGKDGHSTTFSMQSEDSPLMPEQDGIVRGLLLESRFEITAMASAKTRVELLFQADPRGWIPVWVVNIMQRAWPHKVLKGLRARAILAD